MVEILFMVEEDAEGGYVATATGESIVTQADTIDELRENIRDAVLCHFDDAARPRAIRLHFVRDEVLSV
jgi:predicted RNase H-like HicB family nuclease